MRHCQCILQARHSPALGMVSCSHLACSLTNGGAAGKTLDPDMTNPSQWSRAQPYSPLSPTDKAGREMWPPMTAAQTGSLSVVCMADGYLE